MVYLQTQAHKCGASLISDQWLLTAAHCTAGIVLEKSFARVGELSLEKPSGRRVGLKRVVSHPKFRSNSEKKMYSHDIALLQLAQPISTSSTVTPVALATSPRISTSAECWVTGWGYIAEGKELGGTKTLQQVRISVLPDSVCVRSYPHKAADQLCAGDLAGKKDACQNDSGGPLVCRPERGGAAGGFVQVGIVSYGYGCGRKGFPTVYTNVTSYLPFIRKHIHTA
ncbi:hypothetical protein ACEWY4_026477 [Coilia grayii]|uniref:Peptidase S1 domain-containing protein n=1 Tax=Coilia grayii TaxID=363190 RepID=A0ABD1IVC5_9TELE